MTEDYVMYGDDIELSCKIWKAGYKVSYTNHLSPVRGGGLAGFGCDLNLPARGEMRG